MGSHAAKMTGQGEHGNSGNLEHISAELNLGFSILLE